MKRKNFKRRIFSNIIILTVFIGSLLFYSPERHAFSASGVPEITLNSPDEGAVLENSTVVLTGTISDENTATDKLIVTVFEQQMNSSQPVEITSDGKMTITPHNQYADFTFTKDFSAGSHTLTFIVTDGDGISSKMERSFTVKQPDSVQTTVNTAAATAASSSTSAADTTAGSVSNTAVSTSDVTGKRPYLANMYLIPKNTASNYDLENDLPDTFYPAEDMTRVPVDYTILLDIRSSEPLTDTQPLLTSFGDITGKEKFVKIIAVSNSLNAYIYTFTPDQKFTPSITYYVYLNPKFSTKSGIGIIPRFLKFTTVSNNYEQYQFENAKGNNDRDKDYIHGPFSVVTNACAFCHSPHNGSNEFLESGKNGTSGNELCMACHDGTNGSPKIDDNYSQSTHFKDSSVRCTSCHDPHNPGTKSNPNSLHTSSAYKKGSTAKGVTDDFSLCLNCHNGAAKDTKTNNPITNIQQYYNDPAYTVQSGHNFQAASDSGSPLNGQLPCAECHETHGSANSKMLRETLGNIKLSDTNKFKTTGPAWNESDERQFCLKCHNNTTQIYGKTGIFKLNDDATGNPISGHQQNDTQGCSVCHGGTSKSFIEAAHAPAKLTP